MERQRWIAKRQKWIKARATSFLVAMMAYALIFPAHIFALPQGGQVVSGQAGISQTDAHSMLINQTTDKAIINWNQFSIAQPELVRFVQPSATSSALNRIIGGDHRFLLPGTLLTGSALLLASDTIARLMLAPKVLPVSVLTAFTGVPVFIYLILRGYRR